MLESARSNDPTQDAAPTIGDDDDPFERAAADFTRRVRAGEKPSVEEYADRYPEIADLIRELLPTVAAMERAKGDTKETERVAASLARPPERLGDFRIVREIGRGGMGIVYEAVQESLGRNVALKVLPAHVTADERRVRRFDEEAKHAARLHHTNIVPVFGVGADEGLHYYVMQLIDGEGLDRAIARRDGRRMSPRETAKIGRDVARALQCAHAHGILHRDVKPANILVDRQGEVWITDFGLAQALEADGNSTQAHLAGTLNYMPPERFHGVSEPRGDIYSLGVTLYELACGRTPFAAKSSVELMRRITSEAAPPMRSAGVHVPRDLETIIAKATAREPAGRYATAGELAEDLDRFLEGAPIRARRVSSLERVWRWCGRNRVAAAALFTAVASLVSLSIVSAVGYWRTSHLNDDLAHALHGEKTARSAAQTTSTTALEALDRVFERFAPSSSLAVSFGSVSGDGAADDGRTGAVNLGAVPAVSPQIAAALEELIPYYERLAAARGEDVAVERQAASALHRIGVIQARLGRFEQARDVWARADAIVARLLSTESKAKAHVGSADHFDTARLAAEIACDLGDIRRFEDHRDEARADYLRAIAVVDGAVGADDSTPNPATFEMRRERARAYLALGSRDVRGHAAPPEGEHPGGPHEGGPPDGGPPGGGPPHPRRPPPPGMRPPPPPPGSLLLGELQGEPPQGGPYGGPPHGPPGGGPHRGGPPFGGPLGGPGRGGRPNENGPPPGPDGEGPPERRGPPEHGRPEHGPDHHGPGEPPNDDFPDRRERLETAQNQLAKLSAERPDDPVTRLLLARSFRQRAKDNPAGKAEWESADFIRAGEILRQLCAEYPAVPDFAYELTEVLGDFHAQSLPYGSYEAAAAQLDEAIKISDKLLADHPQTTAYLVSNVHLHNRLAAVAGARRRPRDEEAALRKAFDAQRRVVAQFPKSVPQAEWQGRIGLKLSDALLKAGRRDEAVAVLQTAREVVDPFTTGENPERALKDLSQELDRHLADQATRDQEPAAPKPGENKE